MREEAINSEVPKPFSMLYMVQDKNQRRSRYVGSGEELKEFNKTPDEASKWVPHLHNHPYYEVIYVMDGELTHHIEDGIFKYQAGDVCVLNRSVKHFEGSETSFSAVFLNLYPEYINGLFDAVDIFASIPQFKPGIISKFFYANYYTDTQIEQEYLFFSGALRKRSENIAKVQVILDQIACELIRNETGYTFRVQALLLEFFEELQNVNHYHASKLKVDSTSEDFIMAKVMQYMKESRGRISRKELSRMLHYSGNYLNKIVKNQRGITISELSKKLRFMEAKTLLTETDLSISEIIRTSGFSNRTYFYEFFKKAEGVTPLQYRERYEKSKEDEI